MNRNFRGSTDRLQPKHVQSIQQGKPWKTGSREELAYSSCFLLSVCFICSAAQLVSGTSSRCCLSIILVLCCDDVFDLAMFRPKCLSI